jgi:hypothetical protein
MQYWEVVADKLSAAGWSWGYCSAANQHGWRWIVDALSRRFSRANDAEKYNSDAGA